MSKKADKYRQLHLALHGKYSRSMAKDIQKAVREDLNHLWWGNITDKNFQAVLTALKLTETEAVIQKSYIRIGGQIGRLVVKDIDKQIKRVNPFFDSFWLSFVMKFIAPELNGRIVTIKNTLIADLVKVIEADLLNGVINIGEAIDTFVNKSNFYSWQALRIANTETTIAMNTASYQAGKNSGIVMEKEWLATDDDTTRESHLELNGERVAMDEAFSNGLMYPGDSSGDASEVINCRCTLLNVPVRGDDGEIIYDDI